MRNPILIATGVAILCISCTSCHRAGETKNPLTGQPGSRGPGEIDPNVDYSSVGPCDGPPNNWVKEVNPANNDTGRVCSIEVESLGKYGDEYKCDYSAQDVPEPTDHDPVVLTIATGDHVYFWSKQTLANGFRVRRLLPIKENSNKCEQKPFKHEFQKNGPFVPNDNSLVPKPEPVDHCDYKLEVQIETQGQGNPADPDNGGKHYLCFDPHIRLNQ
jgi:hypothetical protein